MNTSIHGLLEALNKQVTASFLDAKEVLLYLKALNGEQSELTARVIELEAAVKALEGQAFNHVISDSETPTPEAPDMVAIAVAKGALKPVPPVSNSVSVEDAAEIVKSLVGEGASGEPMPDLVRRRKEARVSAIQKRVKEYGDELAGLLRELRK